VPAEALKQLRASMLAALAVAIIWVLALPATIDELKDRQTAEHLVTWLLLRSTFVESAGLPSGVEEFRERFVSASPRSEVLDSEMKEPPPWKADLRPGGDNAPYPQPLTIRTLWPDEKLEVRVRLEPWDTVLNKYQVYWVNTDARFLPFDQYAVVLDTTRTCQDCIKVLAREAWVREARAFDFSFRFRDRPLGWDERRALLWTNAASLNDPTKLHLTDPPVMAFLKDVLGAQHAIWGMTLDPGLFFVAPGILLGAQAALLLGALLTLARAHTPAPDQVWTMVFSTTSPPSPVLEALLVIVSLGWIALPPGILAAQAMAGVQLHPFELACLWVGRIGLVATGLANAAAVYQLRRLRRMPA
jgi:hypothetical protein